MSLFSKLFGGGGAASSEPEVVLYSGFRITPTPIKSGNQWRLSARIEKDFGDETKIHNLIRADEISNREEAEAISVRKAKVVIDQLGDDIFD